MNYSLRIFTKIGSVGREGLAQSPFAPLIARKIRGNYILMYHGISAKKTNIFNRRHLYFEHFVKQLKFLKKHFEIISLADYFSGNYDYSRSNFVLTFDDGYLNNFLYAKPVLEQFQVPATFFVTGLNNIGDNILWADFVNIASVLGTKNVVIDGEVFEKKKETYYSADTGKSLYDIIRYERTDYNYKVKVRESFSPQINFSSNPGIQQYWKLMDDAQIRELAASPLLTVGSHGYFHNNLGSVPHPQAMDELEKSKKYLENLTQQKVDKLAYPDGSYTVELIQKAHDIGYNIQLAADVLRCGESPRNEYIQRRRGIYAVGTCLNQIFGAVAEAA